jgi:hypothetical protein
MIQHLLKILGHSEGRIFPKKSEKSGLIVISFLAILTVTFKVSVLLIRKKCKQIIHVKL